MFHFTKKRAVVAAVVGSLALSVGAYAYFTASGTGSGTASTGSASGITITHTNAATLGVLYPAGAGRQVNLDVLNPSDGPQQVGSVKLDSITADAEHGSCDVSSSVTPTNASPAFTMADVPINGRLDGHQTVQTSGTLKMNDTGVSQNNCQGATLTLHFSSN